MKLCECGCGKPVSSAKNRFINHHASHLHLTKEQNPNLISHRKGLSQIKEYGSTLAEKMRRQNSLAQKKVWKERRSELIFRNALTRSKHNIRYPWLTYNRRKKIESVTVNGRIVCENCKEYIIGYKRCHIHHKDKNRVNNNLDNLMVVCAKCHTALDNHIHSKINGRFVIRTQNQ